MTRVHVSDELEELAEESFIPVVLLRRVESRLGIQIRRGISEMTTHFLISSLITFEYFLILTFR